jgi:leader peptidase (prepilin peptidase) / N-methyltransferase
VESRLQSVINNGLGTAMNLAYVASWTLIGLIIGVLLTPAARLLMWSRPSLLRLTTITGPATATAFGVAISIEPPLVDLLAYSVFAAIAVQLALIDLTEQRLPRTLIWPTTAVLLLLLAVDAIHDQSAEAVIRAVAGAAVLVALYLLLGIASHGGLGAGDIRLAGPVGLLLAWHNWQALTLGTLLGLAGSAAAGIITAALARKRVDVPHGPAMLTGAFTALLVPS